MKELSKKDKKALCELISIGMKVEFQRGMNQLKEVMMQWDGKLENAQESYYTLFTALKDFDKKIAWRYNRLSDSGYVDLVVIQILDKLLDVSELDALSVELKENILRSVEFRKQIGFE